MSCTLVEEYVSYFYHGYRLDVYRNDGINVVIDEIMKWCREGRTITKLMLTPYMKRTYYLMGALCVLIDTKTLPPEEVSDRRKAAGLMWRVLSQ